jgi:hypothetical protein
MLVGLILIARRWFSGLRLGRTNGLMKPRVCKVDAVKQTAYSYAGGCKYAWVSAESTEQDGILFLLRTPHRTTLYLHLSGVVVQILPYSAP